MRLLFLLVLVGCTAPAAPGSTRTASVPPTTAGAIASPAQETPPPREGCTDVARDMAKRAPEAKPASVKLDLDGDGAQDPVFTGYCSMMGGNCDTYLYASSDGCPRYVGKVQVTRVSMGPRCVDPPPNGEPCRLSATRMMIHGELYEYFYVYGPRGYEEAGVGHRGERPPH